jgi:hypothetical protein
MGVICKGFKHLKNRDKMSDNVIPRCAMHSGFAPSRALRYAMAYRE